MGRTSITFAFGCLLLALALLDIALWIAVSADSSQSMEGLRKVYLSHFPAFIQAANLSDLQKVRCLTVANAGMLAISTALFGKVHAQSGPVFRKIALGFTIFSGVLVSWQLFSLL